MPTFSYNKSTLVLFDSVSDYDDEADLRKKCTENVSVIIEVNALMNEAQYLESRS